MIKEAKVVEAKDFKEFNGKYGLIIYQNVTLDNGDKINIGKKKHLQPGWTICYSLTGEDDGQQEYKKAKSEKLLDRPEARQSTPAPSQPFPTANPDKRQTSIVRQTCIKAAAELLSGSTRNTTDELIKCAEELENWVNRD